LRRPHGTSRASCSRSVVSSAGVRHDLRSPRQNAPTFCRRYVTAIEFSSASGRRCWTKPTAEGLIRAAQDALPTADAAVSRPVLAAALALLTDLDTQIEQANSQLARLLSDSPVA
jgi:hypothetical protein